MIIVSNTSPINYLILIEHINLLPELYRFTCCRSTAPKHIFLGIRNLAAKVVREALLTNKFSPNNEWGVNS